MNRASFTSNPELQKWRKPPCSSSSERTRKPQRGNRWARSPVVTNKQSRTMVETEIRLLMRISDAASVSKFSPEHHQPVRHERQGLEWFRLVIFPIELLAPSFSFIFAAIWLAFKHHLHDMCWSISELSTFAHQFKLFVLNRLVHATQ